VRVNYALASRPTAGFDIPAAATSEIHLLLLASNFVLAPVTELDPELERFLPQISFGALCQLYNFSYRRFGLRVFA
jgi:hypothetical protein